MKASKIAGLVVGTVFIYMLGYVLGMSPVEADLYARSAYIDLPTLTPGDGIVVNPDNVTQSDAQPVVLPEPTEAQTEVPTAMPTAVLTTISGVTQTDPLDEYNKALTPDFVQLMEWISLTEELSSLMADEPLLALDDTTLETFDTANKAIQRITTNLLAVPVPTGAEVAQYQIDAMATKLTLAADSILEGATYAHAGDFTTGAAKINAGGRHIDEASATLEKYFELVNK